MSEKALLEEVARQPESDEPRLVLADWFDEQEDPRGEYIRVQCQLASRRSAAGKPLNHIEFQQLHHRERELQGDVYALWEPHVPTTVKQWKCIRGVPAHGSMRFADFPEQAADACRRIPLEKLTLTGRATNVDKLAHSPQLNQIRALSLHNNLAPQGGLHALWESPQLSSLRMLQVDDYVFAADEAIAFGTSESLRSLIDLRLQRVHFLNGNVASLTQGPALKNLEVFGLRQTVGLMDFLLSASFGSRLRVLDLNGLTGQLSPITALLDRRKSYRALSHLNLSQTGVTNEQFTAFVSANRFPRLTTLAADVGTVEDEGAYVLASSDMIERLWHVRLNDHRLSDDGIRALWESARRQRQAKYWLENQGRTTRAELKRIQRTVNENFHV